MGLASAGDDGSVQVWEAATQSLVCTYRGHTKRIVTITWSPDGTCLASASQDGTVQIWDATTAEPRLTYRTYASQMTALAWSPDGHLISRQRWRRAGLGGSERNHPLHLSRELRCQHRGGSLVAGWPAASLLYP